MRGGCSYHVYSWLSKKNYDLPMPIDNALRDGESWYDYLTPYNASPISTA
jgi:hypothetical protein